ncbi:disease resistance protein RPV1-like [Juglans microcarpa x Juglans regia]|uniref:disease resistance protein RPV1-like n=1 Tax=Juglans microcarpa x Juglans regia TaxID=2249226 RepID=UPI001B7DADF4|nr:disease resistance protein RPV1-like [Juglans microcarpa x Juglans regia]
MATQTPSLPTSEDIKKRKRDNLSCSKEDEKIIIISSSPSASSSAPRWKHDVFLSFYGKDTRKSFTDHLYVDLKRKGILIFRDDETLKRGKCISQQLLQAIQESQNAIVIFSPNYASSKWCLMELAEIVEWETKTKLITIIPIFYHVNPSDVREQRGTFADAFATHEKDPKVDIKEIDTWRNAFRKVANIVGEHIHERYESTIIQKISGIIFYNYTMLNILIHDSQKLVGINSRVEEMMKLLDMESNDVRFLGIHGMGGVGKTTLAEIIYDRISCQFEGSSFISCIREKSSTRDLAFLQKQLLSMIMQEKIHVWDHHQGIRMIRSMMRNKKVFIVLDDVDSEKQLMALSGTRDWFGPGSRVIITCRDSHLLITHKVNDIYEVELLQTADALQLFSLSAFHRTHPPQNYEDLSMDFVNYAGGLPLALKVLGSFLFGRTIDAWKSARDQLVAIPNKEVMNILQISFDGLEESQQKLFLDVACFSRFGVQWLDNNFKEIYPDIDIEVLVDKSLISKSCMGMLIMHDLLQKMGQEIVRRECPEEPGRRSRLFRVEDVFHVLKNDTGTDAIEGIVLDFYYPKAKHRFINAKAFSKMRKLRFVKFNHFGYIKWCGNPLKYMPTDELRFLEWFEYPSRNWPTSFQPKNLTALSMPGSRFKRLWKGLMVLDNLKYLNLSDSENLIKTPDLTGAPNLEIIDFSGCTSLCKIHPSIEVLKRLQEVRMSGSRIKQLWKWSVVLDDLKYLNLSSSKNLIETPDLTGAPNLEKIDLSGCRTLREVHPSIGVLKVLKELNLDECKCVRRLPDKFCLESLEFLHLVECSRLEKLPDLRRLECLTHFEAWGTAITQIPSVNMIPKSIRSFRLGGRKWMPRKSRDLAIFINDCSLPKQSSYPTYDIGSLVEDEMEGMLEMIRGWSLGSVIPKWVHNTSNGSSVNIDLEGYTNLKGMGCALFIVCDFHDQFHTPLATSVTSLFKKPYTHVGFRLCFETDEGSLEDDSFYYLRFSAHMDDASFVKPIVFWAYILVPQFLECWRSNNLDKRRSFIKISITAKMESFNSDFPTKEIEVKECGVHLLCPDDAGLGLGSKLDSYGRFYSAWKCGMTRNED